MLEAEIVSAPHEVAQKLSVFGTTVDELRSVALQAVAARNSATPAHPINAPGTFSYHDGTAALRMLFISKNSGWKIDRPNGIEAITNKELNLTIVFQNVDRACDDEAPKAISGKGEGARRLVENPTKYLWEYMEEETLQGNNENLWFLCVSCSGDEIRVELSKPRSIHKNQFDSFKERIFIITENDLVPPEQDEDHSEGIEEFDIQVTKKK